MYFLILDVIRLPKKQASICIRRNRNDFWIHFRPFSSNFIHWGKLQYSCSIILWYFVIHSTYFNLNYMLFLSMSFFCRVLQVWKLGHEQDWLLWFVDSIFSFQSSLHPSLARSPHGPLEVHSSSLEHSCAVVSFKSNGMIPHMLFQLLPQSSWCLWLIPLLMVSFQDFSFIWSSKSSLRYEIQTKMFIIFSSDQPINFLYFIICWFPFLVTLIGRHWTWAKGYSWPSQRSDSWCGRSCKRRNRTYSIV